MFKPTDEVLNCHCLGLVLAESRMPWKSGQSLLKGHDVNTINSNEINLNKYCF